MEPVSKSLKLLALALVAGLVFLAGPNAALAQEGEKKDAHAALFAEENYPSASQCAVCHQKIYKQWASSNHAYSSISPMFHKFEQKIYDLTQGTIGSFCVRSLVEICVHPGR